MPVGRRLRYEILRRDEHACRYCGGKAPDVALTVDHVIPVALGGSDEASNLVTACADCNAGKSSSSPDAPMVQDVSEDALRWSRAMEIAAERQRTSAEERAHYLAAFNAAWETWTYADGREVTRPGDYTASVAQWYERGLEIELLEDLVNDVLPRQVPDGRMWRYFCGAVRNVLQQRADMARELLNSGEVA